MVEDFPCECGHSEKIHLKPILNNTVSGYCDHTSKFKTNDRGLKGKRFYDCECEFYRPSNLRYLEELSK